MFEELEKWCNQYKFHCNVFEATNTAYIKTQRDSWVVKVDVGGIKLFHQNTGSRKMKIHNQGRKFFTMDYLVKSLFCHDQYKLFGVKSRVLADGRIVYN